MQTGSIVTTAVLGLNPIVICVNTAKQFLILQFTCKTRFDGCYSAKLHVSFGWNADALAESAESNGFFLFLRREDNRQSKVLRILDDHALGEYRYDDNGNFLLAESRHGDICVYVIASLLVSGKVRYFRQALQTERRFYRLSGKYLSNGSRKQMYTCAR